MDRENLRAAVSAFDPEIPMERALTPPSSWYTDPAIYALERRAVFARTWQVAARVDQVVRPGDYVASVIAGEPVAVVRGDDGTLRAFANTCRHKATPVAVGCGNTRSLVCPYHGWRYGLDGRLQRAPRLGRARGFDRDATGLPPLRVATWGPFVLINADPDAPPLAAQLAPLTAALDAGGWENLRHRTTHTWDIACNWKVFCDNYLDGGYHIAHMHPTLDAQLDMSSYRTEVFERFSIQTSDPSRDEPGGAELVVDPARRIAGGAIYGYLYPNFMINRYGPALDTNLVLPLGPERCRVIFEFFFAPDAEPEFVQTSLDQSDVTQREDIAISESVQIGLGAASYDRGRYAAPEIGIHHFHRLLAADLRRAL